MGARGTYRKDITDDYERVLAFQGIIVVVMCTAFLSVICTFRAPLLTCPDPSHFGKGCLPKGCTESATGKPDPQQ